MNKNLNQQKNIPYVFSVTRYVKKNRIRFHMPGHKGGKGISPELKNYGEIKFLNMT